MSKLQSTFSLRNRLFWGGIRSATISLGAIQSLASENRLLDWDYMSSVSGGGYIASFLGSLFIPEAARDGMTLPAGPWPIEAIARRCSFAFEALKQPPDASTIITDDLPTDGHGPPHLVQSPVRWLRENGRYLAPGGPTDYVTAAAYLTRNWLAMTYVVMIGVMLTLSTIELPCAFMFYKFWPQPLAWIRLQITASSAPATAAISPLLLLAPAGLLLAIAAESRIGPPISFLAVRHPSGSPMLENIRPARCCLRAMLVLGAAAFGYSTWAIMCAPLAVDLPHSLLATGDAQWQASWVPRGAACIGTAIAGIGGLFALAAALVSRKRAGAAFFVADARRRLTLWARNLGLATLVVLAFGLVDTAALHLHDYLLSKSSFSHVAVAAWGALAPTAAWLINKLAGMGRGKSWLKMLVADYLDLATLTLGLALFSILAVQADTLMHFTLWAGFAWPPSANVPANIFVHPEIITIREIILVMPALVILAGLTGFSTVFINLSSLHNFYSARLTRTYLGAANTRRLYELDKRSSGSAGNIQDSQPQDDLDVMHYQTIRTPAPLHLINVTLNETGGRYNAPLIDRDRKGLSLVFKPEGVVLNVMKDLEQTAANKPLTDALPNQQWFPWSKLAEKRVEPLSLGQLCAISGAAVSTGMGANTRLGFSLCLTFANARLGYWWMVRKLVTEAPQRTYGYLFREMIASFRRDTSRVYLSDSGHFENSGAYELLRRNVKVALVLDNGADPDYSFGDLENLVRKARLDMGLEIKPATAAEVAQHFGSNGDELFLIGGNDGWRAAAIANGNSAFALLLEVKNIAQASAPSRLIVWIKPRLVAADAIDVAGYGLAHESFPQESTANQFFDEAQWEAIARSAPALFRDCSKRAAAPTYCAGWVAGSCRALHNRPHRDLRKPLARVRPLFRASRAESPELPCRIKPTVIPAGGTPSSAISCPWPRVRILERKSKIYLS